MRAFLLLTYLQFCTTLLCAQDFKPSTYLSANSDTTFWYGLKKSYAKKYELNSITSDTNQIAFSFWYYGNLIYISKTNSSLYGEVTKYIKEINGKEKSNRTFKKSYPLNKETIDAIFVLIDNSEITAMPSDKFIKNWKQGFDGIEYIIEFKSANKYSFKTYWTPKSQENVIEASTLNNFIERLDSLCRMKSLSNDFDKSIPFKSWTYEGSGTTVARIVNKRKKHRSD